MNCNFLIDLSISFLMCDLIANSVLDFEDATLVSLSRKPLSSSLYFFENGDNLISAQSRITAHSQGPKI